MKTTIKGIKNPSHINNEGSLGEIIVDNEEKIETTVEDLGEKIVVGKDELSDLCATFRSGKDWATIKRNPLNQDQLIITKGHINRQGKDINEGKIACANICSEK